MVTCRLSQIIESPEDEGEGKTFIAVAVGGGVDVAVAVTAVFAPGVVQADRINKPAGSMSWKFFWCDI